MATTFVYARGANRLVAATQTVVVSLGGEPVSCLQHDTGDRKFLSYPTREFWRVKGTGERPVLYSSEDNGMEWLEIIADIVEDVKY